MTHQVFSDAEYERRWDGLRNIIDEFDVDLTILTDADAIFYYTGFSGTPTTYQALLIPRDDDPVHLLRYAEESTFSASAWITQAAFYNDWDDPIAATRDIGRLIAPGARRIGVEKASMYLSARRYERLIDLFKPKAIDDLSEAIGWQRLIKSPEEIDMFRRSVAVIEQGLAAGVEATCEGATERDIAAAIAVALVKAGADTPLVGIIASGERLGQVHGGLSDRRLQPGDLIRLEQSNSVNRYWTRIMRMLSIGEPDQETRELYDLLRSLQQEQIEQLRPGVIPADLDAIVRERIPKGLWGMQLSGYALAFHERSVIGSEIDRFRITRDEHRPVQAGMVLHMYLTFGAGVSISETVAVHEDGPEILTTYPRDLIVR